jgi:integrase
MFMQSGMRRGEILALRWQDVDFARGVVNVRRTVGVIGSRLTVGEPKTKSSRREVPIPAGVMAALEAHYERYQEIEGGHFDGWQDHDLVFSSETGNYINPSNLRRDFLRWVKESGVPQIAIHDLRHTFATHALENGAELIDVSKHLGHARPSITSDIYAHKLYKDHSRVADKVGALFESGPEDVVRNVVRFPRRKRAL